MEAIDLLRMITDGHFHVLQLAIECIELGCRHFLMTLFICLQLKNIVIHHIEYVLLLSLFEENGVHKLVCVARAVL